jgi:hypothetical protein
MPVTRRAFLKLTALAASALAFARAQPPVLWAGVRLVGAAAVPPGCEPQTESAIPLAVPWAVGRECRWPVYLPHVGR